MIARVKARGCRPPACASSISRFHGQTPKVSALGQGMCQNSAIVALRLALAQQARQQREVKVLDQDHRIVGARLRCRRRRRTSGSRLGTAASRLRERPAARTPDGTAATGPRWRIRSSSPALPRASATRGAACSSDHPAARAPDRCESTTSRSAVPLPCATQMPEQARMIGSSAVTMPLAGTCTTGSVGDSRCGCRARGSTR